MNDDIQRQEAMIDEALNSYPQVRLPPGFVNRVMVQVKDQPHVQPERFRLHFLDMALTLLIGSIVTLLLVGVFGYLGIMNLDWLPTETYFSLSFIDNLSETARFWWILGIILFAEIGLGAGVCVQLWQDRPYSAS
jgi:hypothetical protein